MTVIYDEGSGIPNENGTIFWKINGEYHKLDGPSLEDSEGKMWYKNGKKHRTDGPAEDWSYGAKWYFFNGQYVGAEIENPIIGKPIEISNAGFPTNDIGVVLIHVEGVFWEILVGNKKILAYCVDKT